VQIGQHWADAVKKGLRLLDCEIVAGHRGT
jgi:hypothetical protein